jgi:cell division septation protein DedD
VAQQQPANQPAQSGSSWKADYTQGAASVKPQVATAGNYQTYRVQIGAYKNDVNAKEAYNRLVTVGLTGINGFNLVTEPNGGNTRILLTGVLGVDLPQVAQFCGYAGFKEIMAVKE